MPKVKEIDINKDYPAEVLAANPLLAKIMLTNKTMNKFILSSDNLLNSDYSDNLRNKKFRKQDIPITSRNLNDWIHKQNLLIDDRDDIEQWHAFSKIDVAYIYILKACRDFGISVRKLQTTRDSLSEILPGTAFSLIEIAYTYFDKEKNSGDIYLYMDDSGRCNIVRIDDIVWMTQEKMINKNFILNLTEVWNEM